MDVGMTKFETNSKMVTLMDAPGHKDFIPNMITGAAQVQHAALMLTNCCYSRANEKTTECQKAKGNVQCVYRLRILGFY